jgi:hypothetical protein
MNRPPVFASVASEETSGLSSEASWFKGFRANETGEIQFGGKGGALADEEIVNAANAKITVRPTWRQSEIDIGNEYSDFNPQKSFIDGEEVKYGTSGSSRPDLYQNGSSIEIKNYNITTSTGRSNVARNIEKQYLQRLEDLPAGTNQTVMIDVRGQNVTDEILESLHDNIMNRTNNGINIVFKTK